MGYYAKTCVSEGFFHLIATAWHFASFPNADCWAARWALIFTGVAIQFPLVIVRLITGPVVDRLLHRKLSSMQLCVPVLSWCYFASWLVYCSLPCWLLLCIFLYMYTAVNLSCSLSGSQPPVLCETALWLWQSGTCKHTTFKMLPAYLNYFIY